MEATDHNKAAPLWDPTIDGDNQPTVIRTATEGQRRAADPQVTAWVAASAGTGKTLVLTNRLLALLLEGVLPSQILALTFTKAAAAEMADRVSKALEKWVTLSDEKLREELFRLAGNHPCAEQMALARRLFARMLEAPGGLNIQTIHAFAQSLLGRFPVESGVQPGFRVLDDGEAAALLETSVDRHLVGLVTREDRASAQVFEILGEDSFRGLIAALVRERGRLLRLRGASKRSAAEILAPFREMLGLKDGTTAEELRECMICGGQPPKPVRNALRAYAEWAHRTGKQPNSRNAPAFDAIEWLGLPDDAARRLKWETYQNFLLNGEDKPRNFEYMLTKGFFKDEPVARDALEQEKERVCRLRNSMKALRQADISAALLDTAFSVLDDYEALKAARSRVDFDDLILRTIHLLTADAGAGLWVAFKLDQGLRHVLVDEAQDTNPDQWAIVRGLTNAFYDGTDPEMGQPDKGFRTSFVVGDLKQSIYGFQRADPQVFQAMKQRFEDDVQRAGQNWLAQTLNVTFRSSQPILTAVDCLFRHGENASGLTFDGEGWPAHLSGKAGAGGLVEVWQQIEAPPKDKAASVNLLDDDEDQESRPEVELAEILANRIARWTKGDARPGDQGWLEGQGRPMRPEDIMVLMRSRSGPFISTLTQRLKTRGVRVAGADRLKLHEEIAVRDLIVLTEYLLQPADDLGLATVLRSPLCGISEARLFDWAHNRSRGETLETAIVKAAESGRSSEAQDVLRLIRTLRGQLASTPHTFFSFLLNRLGGSERFAARLGPQGSDALREFLRAALTYERANTPTLPGFLGWLRKAEIEVKRDQDSTDGGVRIMTAHGAKGLEAPVVILPQTQRRTDDTIRDQLRWWDSQSPEDGTFDFDGQPLPYWKPSEPDRPEQIAVLETAEKKRAMEEERRLLYVALTRAKERLYIAGWKTRRNGTGDENRNSSPTALSWYDQVKEAFEAADPSMGIVSLKPVDGEKAAPIFRLYQPHQPDQKSSGDRDQTPDAAPSQIRGRVAPDLLARLRTPAPDEPSPPRPFAPSQMLEDPAAPSPLASLRALQGQVEPVQAGAPLTAPQGAGAEAPTLRGHKSASPFFRGNVLHALLQRLPVLPPEDREDAARRYLSRPALGLEATQVDRWSQEVLAITNGDAFADLFARDSRAEVAVTGLIGHLVVSGQIDRLIEREHDVWIVDYKTNRPPPIDPDHVAASYRAQLAAYKAVLEDLYPSKPIRTFLLWTDGPHLMEVKVNADDLPPLAKIAAND